MENDRKTRILVTFQMVTIAMGTLSIPALITTFQDVYNLSISQSAIIPVISTIGGFLTNLIVASFSAGIGLKRLNLIYLFISMVSLIILATTSNLYVFLFGITLIGIATAFGLSNTSTVFAHIDKGLQNYGLFHAFFGVGGIIAPIIISFILTHNISYRFFYGLLAIINLMFFLLVLFSNWIENHSYEQIRLKEAVQILKKPFIIPVLLIFTLQSGSEQGAVMWIGNYFEKIMSIGAESTSLILSIYWIAFTLSRLLVHLVESRLGKLNTTKLFVGIAIASLVLLLATDSTVFFIILAVAVAPVFPMMQKYSAQKLPDRELGLFNGLVFALASMGAVPLSGIIGFLVDSSQDEIDAQASLYFPGTYLTNCFCYSFSFKTAEKKWCR